MSSSLKRVTLQEAKKHFTGFDVTEAENGNGFTLSFKTIVSASLRPSRERMVNITVPYLLPPSFSGGPLWPFAGFQTHYGREITLRMAGSIFHEQWTSREIMRRSFGVLPGTFYYQGEDFCFEMELDPMAERVSSLLFYADTPFYSASASKEGGITTFKLGDQEIYGIILPINYLVSNRPSTGGCINPAFSGSSSAALRGKMACNMAKYLGCGEALATIA